MNDSLALAATTLGHFEASHPLRWCPARRVAACLQLPAEFGSVWHYDVAALGIANHEALVPLGVVKGDQQANAGIQFDLDCPPLRGGENEVEVRFSSYGPRGYGDKYSAFKGQRSSKPAVLIGVEITITYQKG